MAYNWLIDDIIRGGLDIVTDKTKKKPKAVLEPRPAYGCVVNKPKAEQETAQPTAARLNKHFSQTAMFCLNSYFANLTKCS